MGNNKDYRRNKQNRNKKKIGQIIETQSWFFEKINKTDNPKSRLIKKKKERTQVNKIMDERKDIATNTSDIQTILREYYEQLHSNKLVNLEEMNQFLDTHELPKLKEEEIENLNRPIQ